MGISREDCCSPLIVAILTASKAPCVQPSTRLCAGSMYRSMRLLAGEYLDFALKPSYTLGIGAHTSVKKRMWNV